MHNSFNEMIEDCSCDCHADYVVEILKSYSPETVTKLAWDRGYEGKTKKQSLKDLHEYCEKKYELTHTRQLTPTLIT